MSISLKPVPFQLFHRGASFRTRPATMPREEWGRYCDAFALVVAFPESAELSADELHQVVASVVYTDAKPAEALRAELKGVQ